LIGDRKLKEHVELIAGKLDALALVAFAALAVASVALVIALANRNG